MSATLARFCHLSALYAALFLVFCISVPATAQTPGLYINEVSQGASGNKEYVELIVTGIPTCAGIPTLDLRGWYLDDNNGTHATGSGTGIAQGCMRFTQNAFWSAIPAGTLIVIYNNNDINANIPANDLSMTDGNCRLVIPADNCTLFEKHATQPNATLAAYPTTGFTACGDWVTLSMANGDDSFHTVNPAGTVFHAVSWGNNTLNNVIYFAGSSGGQVAYMNNAVSGNITQQGNWTRLPVAGNETPGQPNNAVNQAWIAAMNNNCTPVQPLALSVNTTAAGCTCIGTATAAVSGGIGTYTYAWSPVVAGNTPIAGNLCPGSYTLTVSDAVGCTSTQTFSIAGSTVFTLSAVTTPVSCAGGNNGSATAAPAGGNGPYNFSWAPSGGNAPTATGLTAGSYTCTVTDASGCTNTVQVNITQPAAISISTVTQAAGCAQSNGSVTATASGGTGQLSYQWTNGPATATYSNLAAGTYTLTVTDANGCTATSTVAITSSAGVTATLTSTTNASCNGSSDGSIVTTASGGQGPYTYNWSAPASSATGTASGLSAGSYTLTVTDFNGCTSQVTATITQPLSVSAVLTAAPQTVCLGSSTQLNATATGGNGSYTYSWIPAAANASSISVTPQASTTYSVVVTDANGCIGGGAISVAVAQLPAVNFSADSLSGCAPLCVNFTDLSAVQLPATVSNWSWNFGDAGSSAVQDAAHCYTASGVFDVSLTVTSSDGCTATYTAPAFISVSPKPVAAFSTSPQPLSIADPTVFFTSTSQNAVTWNWSFGDINISSSQLENPQFTYPSAICYTVRLEVTSNNSCTDDTTQEICIEPEISLYIPNSFTPNGDGQNDVFAPQGNGLVAEDYELLIFDRWGNLLFESNSLSQGWDGREQGKAELVQNDTYIWKLRVRTATGRPLYRVGHVNVIR
jgi:gliding motility-associated-like protein